MCANALSCGPSADHRQVLLKSKVALEISRNGSTIPFGIAHHFVSFSLSLKYTTSGEYPGCDKGGCDKRGCDKRRLRQRGFLACSSGFNGPLANKRLVCVRSLRHVAPVMCPICGWHEGARKCWPRGRCGGRVKPGVYFYHRMDFTLSDGNLTITPTCSSPPLPRATGRCRGLPPRVLSRWRYR